MRVENPAASCLDESSGKVLNADHDNQAELRDLTVSTHLSFEIVRDRRLNGPEAVLRNLTVSNHFSFEIVRDQRLNGPHELFYPITSIRHRAIHVQSLALGLSPIQGPSPIQSTFKHGIKYMSTRQSGETQMEARTLA